MSNVVQLEFSGEEESKSERLLMNVAEQTNQRSIRPRGSLYLILSSNSTSDVRSSLLFSLLSPGVTTALPISVWNSAPSYPSPEMEIGRRHPQATCQFCMDLDSINKMPLCVGPVG